MNEKLHIHGWLWVGSCVYCWLGVDRMGRCVWSWVVGVNENLHPGGWMWIGRCMYCWLGVDMRDRCVGLDPDLHLVLCRT